MLWLSGTIILSAVLIAAHLNEIKKQLEMLNAYYAWFQLQHNAAKEELKEGREEPFA